MNTPYRVNLTNIYQQTNKKSLNLIKMRVFYVVLYTTLLIKCIKLDFRFNIIVTLKTILCLWFHKDLKYNTFKTYVYDIYK